MNRCTECTLSLSCSVHIVQCAVHRPQHISKHLVCPEVSAAQLTRTSQYTFGLDYNGSPKVCTARIFVSFVSYCVHRTDVQTDTELL